MNLGSEKLIEYSGGTTRFFHSDHLGSPRVRTDMSATEDASWDNLPFGETWASSGMSGDQHKYTGHMRDDETGNDYAGARYYANWAGRWLGADRIGGDARSPRSLNRFSYTLNDPINLVDPDGNSPIPSPFLGGTGWNSPLSSCASFYVPFLETSLPGACMSGSSLLGERTQFELEIGSGEGEPSGGQRISARQAAYNLMKSLSAILEKGVKDRLEEHKAQNDDCYKALSSVKYNGIDMFSWAGFGVDGFEVWDTTEPLIAGLKLSDIGVVSTGSPQDQLLTKELGPNLAVTLVNSLTTISPIVIGTLFHNSSEGVQNGTLIHEGLHAGTRLSDTEPASRLGLGDHLAPTVASRKIGEFFQAHGCDD